MRLIIPRSVNFRRLDQLLQLVDTSERRLQPILQQEPPAQLRPPSAGWLLGRRIGTPEERLRRPFSSISWPSSGAQVDFEALSGRAVLEDVLVELLVTPLPADADVPVIACAPERTWIWSDLHLPGLPWDT